MRIAFLRPRWWAAGAACTLAVILYVTLYPMPQGVGPAAATPLLCLVCGPRGGVDVFLNVLMLVPLGFCLRLAGWSWRRTTLACALLSLSIESLQYFVVVGRDASLSDVLSNTTGGALGAAMAPRLGILLAPGPKAARALTLSGAALWLGIAGLSSWSFRPWHEDEGALVEHSDSSALSDAYRGRIGRAAVSGTSFTEGWLDTPESEQIRALFSSGVMDLSLDVVSQAPPQNELWIYRMRIGAGIASVSQRRRALMAEMPRRVSRLRIPGPALRLDGAAPDKAGVPFHIQAGERGQLLWLEATVNGRTRRADLLLEPMMAWGLAIPFGYAFGPEAAALTMVWVAGLMLPLGYWASRWGRPKPATIVVAVAIGAGLGLIPWLAGTGPVPVRDWIAAVAGAAAGWAVRASAAYLATRCGSPSASEFFSS